MNNRNQISHFAVNPKVDIQRSRFPLHQNIKFTGNAADIIPFYCTEVLPGDTFDVQTSLVCRMQTLIHPILDNLYLDTYFFFVPNRLIWDNWQKFCGEPDKAWMPTREYIVPKIGIRLDAELDRDPVVYGVRAFKDSVLDYLGVGFNPNIDTSAFPQAGYVKIFVNALPVRAYNKIYDDWFRDENLIDPVNLYTGDASVEAVFTYDNGIPVKGSPLVGGYCYKAAKYHDYFTSALPQPQRGEPVNLFQEIGGGSISGYAPVVPRDVTAYVTLGTPVKFASTYDTTAPSQYLAPNGNLSTSKIAAVLSGNQNEQNKMAPINLWADLNGLSSGSTGDVSLTINDLRMAFQVQKFMERSARYGARYIELLKGMFGVSSPDARLQRSEYLGGHRVPINIHQIVNQTESIDAPLGNVGAMSLTSDTHKDFIHSFTEHGYVLGLCVIRYKNSYSQGMSRMWNRSTKYDFYWPVFANLGEQAILNKEIFAQPDIVQGFENYNSTNDDVFGYQERWAEYRYMPDRVAGEMRPGIENTLASWHLGDYYTELPTLSESWIETDKAPIDRAVAVTSSVADQFLFDVLVQNMATRPMPVYSIPGLADHH